MDIDWLRKICLALPHATEQIQWGNDLLFKVHGKMFAVTPLEPAAVCLSFKCSEEAFAELTERPNIVPAPYLARAKWVALETQDALARDELAALLRASYALVVARLPKKLQTAGKKPGRKPPGAALKSRKRKKKKPMSARRWGKTDSRGENLGCHSFRGCIRDGPAQRLGARKREGHIPEVDVSGKELEADIGLAVALALNRSHPRFDFARAVFIDQQNHLTHHQRVLALDLRAVLAYRVGLDADGELLGVFILPVDNQRHDKTYALGASTLFAAKVK